MKARRGPRGCEVLLEGGVPVNGHRPSVDVLFNTVAQEFGPRAIGLILTGMGSDGAAGLGEIKAGGGHTIAQDKESSAVYGMPRAAADRGFVHKVLPLVEIPAYLSATVGTASRLEDKYVFA
jgi:two-component system chemotaxis response regulator CheB